MPSKTLQRGSDPGSDTDIDLVVRAVGDPNRRRILELIRQDEYSVGQIAERFPVSRPAISQHLRVLEAAELVEVRASGRRRYYRCRPEGLGLLRSWLDEFWTDRLERLKDEVEREHQRRNEEPDRNGPEGNDSTERASTKEGR